MSRLKPGRTLDSMRKKIMNVAARSFLKNGFTATKIKDIAEECGYSLGSVTNLYPHKEDILCALADFVLSGQYQAAEQLLKECSDPVVYYVIDTVLELHMTENSSAICDIYMAAYSLPKVSDEIYKKMAKRLQFSFQKNFPAYTERDFYELDIATASIMRGFISIPCSEEFSMEQKVRRFLETSLRIFKISEDEIEGYITLASKFDFEKIASDTIEQMLIELDRSCE